MSTDQHISNDLRSEIDALSLGQALVDFELANARVLDLTARLVEANERVRRFGRDADAARASVQGVCDERDRMGAELSRVSADALELRRVIEHRDARVAELESEIVARDAQVQAALSEMAALRGSKTFRVASKIGSLKRFLR
jgi:chromosome segregation ATPase